MIVFCSNLETLGTQFLTVDDVVEIARTIAERANLRANLRDWQTSSYYPYWHGGKYSGHGSVGFVWSDSIRCLQDRDSVVSIMEAYAALIHETDAELARDELAERASDDCVVDS